MSIIVVYVIGVAYYRAKHLPGEYERIETSYTTNAVVVIQSTFVPATTAKGESEGVLFKSDIKFNIPARYSVTLVDSNQHTWVITQPYWAQKLQARYKVGDKFEVLLQDFSVVRRERKTDKVTWVEPLRDRQHIWFINMN